MSQEALQTALDKQLDPHLSSPAPPVQTNAPTPQVEDAARESPVTEAQDLLKDIIPSATTNPAPPCLSQLCRLVGLKYQLIIAYISYVDQLRSFARDGIYTHLQTHIAEERQQAYELNKKITALGADAPAEVPPVPAVKLDDPRAIFQALLQLELAAVQAWQDIFKATSDDAALNGMAQNGALQDQQHADDLKRYLRSASGG